MCGGSLTIFPVPLLSSLPRYLLSFPSPLLPPLSPSPSLPSLFFSRVLMSLSAVFFSLSLSPFFSWGRKRDYAKPLLGETSLILPVAAPCTREKQPGREHSYKPEGGKAAVVETKMGMASNIEHTHVFLHRWLVWPTPALFVGHSCRTDAFFSQAIMRYDMICI